MQTGSICKQHLAARVNMDQMFFLVLGNGRLKRCGGNELSLDELADIAAQHQQQRPQARTGQRRGRGRRYNFQTGQTARRRSKAMRKRHEASRRLSKPASSCSCEYFRAQPDW